MDINDFSHLPSLTTWKLVLELLEDPSEANKFQILKIIEQRDKDNNHSPLLQKETNNEVGVKMFKPKKTTPPLKGSKAEKILNLYNSGLVSAKAIMDALTKKKITVYYPEIYRVLKDYTDFKRN